MGPLVSQTIVRLKRSHELSPTMYEELGPSFNNQLNSNPIKIFRNVLVYF